MIHHDHLPKVEQDVGERLGQVVLKKNFSVLSHTAGALQCVVVHDFWGRLQQLAHVDP